MGFFSDLEEVPENQRKGGFFSDLPEETSRTRSILSAFPKGLIKGATTLSEMHDPISSFIKGFKEKRPDLQEKLTERFLPTQKGNVTEDILETAGEMAPSFALG